MESIKEIQESNIIGLDTSIFIYFIEENPKYYNLLKDIFGRCYSGTKPLKLVTSIITLIEVLTKPMKLGNTDLAKKYRDILLNSENVLVLPIENNIAEKSAELRAKYNFLRTPDAIQIATSICTDTKHFLSNDIKLKNVKEVKCLTLDEYCGKAVN